MVRLRSPQVFKQKGFAAVFIIIPVVILVAVASSFFLFKHNSSPGSIFELHNNSADAFMRQYGRGCQDRPVSFTAAPLALNQLGFIKPLGLVSDGHVTPIDHLYFHAIDQNAADNTYPVYMPGDGTVVQIQKVAAQYVAAAEDHFIVISHSCRYYSIFIHVHKLAPVLATAVGKLQPNQNKSVNVQLRAGDMIGYIKASYDWIPVDTQNTLSGFIHPESYAIEPWKIHVFDPFTLFSGELKQQLLAKDVRTAEPRAGKIDYDQPGKLVGNWFRDGSGKYAGSGTGRPWDGHLAIAPDFLDSASTLVSIGNWDGVAKQFTVRGLANPAGVSASTGIVKYELLERKYLIASGTPWADRVGYAAGIHPSQDTNLVGTIVFQVLPGEKLKVETFPGKTAGEVSGFTEKAKMYER